MENSKVLIESAYKKYTNKSKYRFSWVWHALSFAFPTLVYWLASAVVFLLCGWYSFYHQEYVEEVGLDAWALAYTTFGVLLSLIVIVATRDLKFFGKSFFSLFKAKFVSPRNYLSSFLYWSLALFVYCLVEFLLGNKGALFCGSFILFVVSVICILMLFFDLVRPLDRYWLSFLKSGGLVPKERYYLDYRFSTMGVSESRDADKISKLLVRFGYHYSALKTVFLALKTQYQEGGLSSQDVSCFGALLDAASKNVANYSSLVCCCDTLRSVVSFCQKEIRETDSSFKKKLLKMAYSGIQNLANAPVFKIQNPAIKKMTLETLEKEIGSDEAVRHRLTSLGLEYFFTSSTFSNLVDSFLAAQSVGGGVISDEEIKALKETASSLTAGFGQSSPILQFASKNDQAYFVNRFAAISGITLGFGLEEDLIPQLDAHHIISD